MCMFGLDAAGKTTILYKLHLGENVVTIPTIGFNVEAIKYKNLKMTIWDVGGQHRLRPLWRHYFSGTDAIIFVVDSTDKERMNEAREELHRIVSDDELWNSALLIFANKQDLPRAAGITEIVNELGLNQLKKKNWHVQGTCATIGEGLYEGLEWLSQNILHN